MSDPVGYLYIFFLAMLVISYPVGLTVAVLLLLRKPVSSLFRRLPTLAAISALLSASFLLISLFLYGGADAMISPTFRAMSDVLSSLTSVQPFTTLFIVGSIISAGLYPFTTTATIIYVIAKPIRCWKETGFKKLCKAHLIESIFVLQFVLIASRTTLSDPLL